MKFLFDIFPVVLFLAAYKLANIFVATAVVIAATFVQIAWVWLRTRKVEPMLWVSLAIIVVFGGATLLLQDETFIKWKPTVLYWLFCVVLLVADHLFGRNLMRAMMGKQMELPQRVWTRLNQSWAVFFASSPGQAITYQIGKLQIIKFLADARLNQKEQFNLRAFHDYLWKNGNVPIALLRWEHLGLSDEIELLDALV